MENTYIQVVTTTNTLSEAEAIAMTVLESRLAVCMQITPCTSFYHWKEKIEKAEEFRCLMKTKRELFPQLSAKIQTMHSYETPEIEPPPKFRQPILEISGLFEPPPKFRQPILEISGLLEIAP